MNESSAELSSALQTVLARALERAHGWLPFDQFMALALYAPGLGYYSRGRPTFGHMPADGSDFVTAPELSPLFGLALAPTVAEALHATGVADIWEFGAGSGALAEQLLLALQARDVPVRRYTIVELSATLRARQQERLHAFGDRVRWLDELPGDGAPPIQGVVVGNEVLDAMPVKLLARSQGRWHERGVVMQGDAFAFADRPTDLRPPYEVPGEHDYVTEVHPQAEAFVRTLAQQFLRAQPARAVALFIDYGFPEAEYYHEQRSMGTLACHQHHRTDDQPLLDLGGKDITAHVNFTSVALTAQDAGLQVLGYTSQARLLINNGLPDLMQTVSVQERARAGVLMHEHEMGELFKAIVLATPDVTYEPHGFSLGDRTHRL